MKQQYLLAFDVGTGAGRCVLVDTNGSLIASSYAEWSYTQPAEAPEHGQAFDPKEFWSILCRLSKQVISQANILPQKIIGVSTTSQRQGMVFIDKGGVELYAGPNVDLRGKTQTKLLEVHADEIRSVTGLRLSGSYGPPRLLWIKEHQPQIYDSIHRIMMMSDWVAFRLSGEVASEPSVASSSQLLNLNKRNWSDRMIELANLRDDIFPNVSLAGERIGSITHQAARETGLAPGTAVVSGGGDTQLGLLGMGLTNAKQIGAVAGTSTPLMLTIDHVLIDEKKRVSTNCHVISGLWTLESNAGMTGLPYRWVRDTFGQDVSKKAAENGIDPFEYMSLMAEQVPVGADGWMAFIGSGSARRQRQSNLGGFIFPITWTLDHFDKRHMFRAALETMAFGIRTNADQLAEVAGSSMNHIHVCGGQTKNAFFNQLLANTVNMPVHIYRVKEATGLGAAMCAAVGAGFYEDLNGAAEGMVHLEQIIDPEPKSVPAYQEAYERWSKMSRHLGHFPG